MSREIAQFRPTRIEFVKNGNLDVSTITALRFDKAVRFYFGATVSTATASTHSATLATKGILWVNPSVNRIKIMSPATARAEIM